MGRTKVVGNKFTERIPVVFFLCFFVFSLTGCEPLRKKFIRQKKKGQESSGIQPVLTPIDYPAVVHSSLERYAYHYSLWKVWDRELMQALHEKKNDKKIRSLLEQLMVQLDGMRTMSGTGHEEDISRLMAEYHEVKNSLEQTAAFRNTYAIQKRLSSASKTIRNELNPKRLQAESETFGTKESF